jgi:hypothetical protein
MSLIDRPFVQRRIISVPSANASDAPAQRLRKMQIALSAPPQPIGIAGAHVYAGGLDLAHDLSETLKALKGLTEAFENKDVSRRKRAKVLENARKVLGVDA